MTPHSPAPSPPGKLPLLVVMVVPFVLQIFAAVGLTGYLSLRNGQRAVNTLVNQLSDEVADNVEHRIQTFADTSYQFLQINLAVAQTNKLSLNDLSGLGEYFWHQIQITDAVPYVYYGNEQGDFVGVWKESDQVTTLRYRDQTLAPNREIYELDDEGNPTSLVKVHEYDPRLRPWYDTAVETAGPIWSSVYVFALPPTLGITHAAPIYDDADNLLGVMAIDLTLKDISNFLQGIKVSESGVVFILERSGEMIASSVSEPPVIATDDEEQRLMAVDSQHPLIHGTAVDLQGRFDTLDQIQSSEQVTIMIDGENHFLQVRPIQGAQDLDWLMAVVIPEANFMAQINASTRNTIVLCWVAFAIATLIGIITSRWITRPILQLSHVSQHLAQQPTPTSSQTLIPLLPQPSVKTMGIREYGASRVACHPGR